MRSMSAILNLVIDGEINTPAEGAALLDEEAGEYAAALHIPQDDARAQLLRQIEDSTRRLCPPNRAERLQEIYGFHLPSL